MHRNRHLYKFGMKVIDYNGDGPWSRAELLARYADYAAKEKIVPRDLAPMEQSDGERKWVYPVMDMVIAGIEAGDRACIRIGIEFIEEDCGFPFGKTLKSNTARALRRATLTEDQKHRIRRRVFHMLSAGFVPHEYREYAKLVRKIGFEWAEVPEVPQDNVFALRYYKYFEMIKRAAS